MDPQSRYCWIKAKTPSQRRDTLAQDPNHANVATKTCPRKIPTDRTNSYLPPMHNSSEVPRLLAVKSEFIRD